MSHQSLYAVAILVRDYDDAIDYYSRVLGFALVEDTAMGPNKRFVRVQPPGSEASLLLAQAKNDAERAAIGNQTGGRVFLFLHTDNFDRDYARYREHNVHFIEQPRNEAYGKVVVFEDLYGNRWDLIEPSS